MFHRFRNYRAVIGTIAVGLTLSFTVAPSYAGSGRINACKLVSAAAAGRILGTRVTVKPINTSAAEPDAASICDYDTGSLHGGVMLIAGRIHYTNAAAEVAYEKKTAANDVPPLGVDYQPTFVDVRGLGEAAYLLKVQGSFQLHVLAHGAGVVISMLQDANSKTLAQSKSLPASPSAISGRGMAMNEKRFTNSRQD